MCMYRQLSISQVCEVIRRHVTHVQGKCLGRPKADSGSCFSLTAVQ